MRRVQFIEFHDQPWFPSFLRDYVTDALQFGFNLFDVYAPVAPLLERVTESTGSRSIVDMCSGAGGPWLDLSRKLDSRKSPANAPALQICLTDRYPNLGAFEKVRAASDGRIRFYPGSVDATNVPRELKGLRTMFTSFHHFLPDAGRAILQDAVDAGEGIGIFEIARRAPSAIGLAFGFVLALFACTPWIRPFRWSRLLWTYLLPIIPFVLLFDGVVSCLRTYRPQEMIEIVDRLKASDYQWEAGELPTRYMPITYLIGYPRASSRGTGSIA
ncbi:MAG: hypothetical protein WBF54_03170 [Terriglobales bacterium]